MTTQQEKLALWVAILAFVAGAGAQLSDIFSPLGAYAPLVVKEITTVAGIGGGIMGIVLRARSGTDAQITSVIQHADEPGVQQALVTAVADYPGVDSVKTNANASPTLLALKVDPAAPKVI